MLSLDIHIPASFLVYLFLHAVLHFFFHNLLTFIDVFNLFFMIFLPGVLLATTVIRKLLLTGER